MTWDIRSGKCVSMFHGHDADINSVDVSACITKKRFARLACMCVCTYAYR